jgi:type III pantothenate kinase
MDLLFDVGNTRLKWVLMDEDGEIHARGAELDFEPPGLPTGQSLSRIAIAAVRDGPALATLLDWADTVLPGKVTRLVTPSSLDGLRIAYQEPARLGVDRWLAMLGAWQRSRAGFVVVDCGTAVTIDLVDDAGQHLGGAILPGIDLMVESLINRASGIRPKPEDFPPGFPARDTGSAVTTGARLAVRGAIREALAAAVAHTVPRVVMTGGAAPELAADLSDLRPELDDDLVFQGMRGMLACSD